MNYQEKMNNIQMLINKIINNSKLHDPYIFKKFILDDSNNTNSVILDDSNNTNSTILDDSNNTNSVILEKPKKKVINFNKINKVINEENNLVNVTTENIHNKFNEIVKKINNKLQTEISKDMFTYSEILTNKESKDNIFNMICLSILNKIEKIVN